MKELSIEQKVKRYDEAIEKFDVILNLNTVKESGTIFADDVRKIFPELKESEDERIRKELICFLETEIPQCNARDKYITWLEKQGDKAIDSPQNHRDMNNPSGCIVLEDFNGGEGFYKLHLDYLNKKQVEEVEEMIRTWNKESILNYGRP